MTTITTSIEPEADHTASGRRARELAEHRGAAMGTSSHVVIVGGRPNDLVDDAEIMIHELEQQWSRFVADSDVSRMNRAAGQFVGVAPATVELVSRAVTAWHLTTGRFDPTVLHDMLDLGYDSDFDEVRQRVPQPDQPRVRSSRPLGDARRRDCGGIEIDLDARAVRLPFGVGFDPGGIGKGLAADRITAAMIERGASGALVNLGGDVRVRGVPPEGDAWLIGIGERTIRPTPYTTVALTDGAVTTSTSQRRRWQQADGSWVHHVVDPETGQAHADADDAIILAAAVAGEGWWAEAASTASIGSDPRTSFEHAPLVGVETFCVNANGTEIRSSGFESYER